MKIKNPIFCLVVLLLVGVGNTTFAQQKMSMSIKAQATVIEQSGIELITIKNMDIDPGLAVEGKVYISSHRDASAAVMMIKGKANARFRVNYTPVVRIANTSGPGFLTLRYEMRGFQSDNQSASEPIDAAVRTLQLSSDSKYYFWVGGTVDVRNARPGTYDGEFTIEVEYI